MEFQYRAVDDRRSRSPPPQPATPSTPGSGSAGGHGGDDAPAERVGNSSVTLWWPAAQPPPPEPAADELRRRAEKARIRERILREQAEHWELELEVRSELREQMLRLSRPVLGPSARGSDLPPAPALAPRTILGANSSLPAIALEAHPKENALAASSAKRKSPDRATAASTALLAARSKKQKTTLTCMVCCITANSEKAMQDHLNGKAHKRKAVALPQLPKAVTETQQERGLESGEEEAMATETLGDYKPMKFMMVTSEGALDEVTQMDGYLLCELCNVRTADRVTMMCHLQGNKHVSNVQKKRQPSSKPSNVAACTVSAAKKCVEGTSMLEADPSAIASADPDKLVLEDYHVLLPQTVRFLEGFLLCELCDVKAPSMNGMRQHLSGKKHKHKAKTSSDVSVNVSTDGKEAAKSQPMEIDMAVVSAMAAKLEAPLAKSLQPKLGNDRELLEMNVAPPQEVPTGDSTKTPGMEVIKSSAASAGALLNNICDSDSLTMEVDSVMHPLQRVDGFLVCLSCNVKAPSEIIMQSHLAGKKHKRKMMTPPALGDNSSKSTKAIVKAELAPPAVAHAKTAIAMEPMEGDGVAEVEPATHSEPAEVGYITRVQSNSPKSVKDDEEVESAPSLAVSQTKSTAAMVSMAVDGTAEAQLATCITGPAEDCEITEEAEGVHAAADSNGSMTQGMESVRTDVNTTAPGKPIKIQVEGKVFAVMQQENGRLSCELCGVHGCDKDRMIQHLYTSAHWGKASPAKKIEKKQACVAAVAVVDKDDEVGSMAGEGSDGLTSDINVGVIISDGK